MPDSRDDDKTIVQPRGADAAPAALPEPARTADEGPALPIGTRVAEFEITGIPHDALRDALRITLDAPDHRNEAMWFVPFYDVQADDDGIVRVVALSEGCSAASDLSSPAAAGGAGSLARACPIRPNGHAVAAARAAEAA